MLLSGAMEWHRSYLEPITEYSEEEDDDEDGDAAADYFSHVDTGDDISEIEEDQCNWSHVSEVDPTADLMIWETLRSESSSSLSENKRLFDEKEKPLQKKVGDLQTQVQKLERKTMLLKTENDALKKKQEDHKSRQEKLKSLRKRNTELAGIAQRLELKAKILQQQNLEKSDDGDHVKKLRQRTRDNTAHAKTLLEKEKEIEDLKKNYKELAEKISNMQSNLPQNLHLYEEQEELESIIKQAAKERLQLEKQLVKAKMATQTQVASCEVNGENGKTNLFVDVQKDKLQQTLKQLADLEKSNQELQAKLSLLETCDKTKEMEKELQETQSRNTQLEENVNVLEKQVKQIEMVNEECKTLKESLAQQENECLLAKEQVSALESKINSLELVIKDLKKSSSRLKTLEKEHELTFQQLKKKQDEVRTLQEEKDAAQSQHEESVQALMSKLMELEHKYQMQEMKQKELNLELVLLQEQKHLVGSPGGRKSDKRSLSQNSLDGSQNQRSAQNMNRSSGRLLADGRLPALIDSGQLQVYIAKYNYDPFQFSPNENPEAELPLSSGDYVFISGEMDEDGFFEGELIDGKKGLVPSNFVEKVPDVDLIDFPSILVASGHHSDDSVLANLAVQQDLEFNSSDESEQMSAVLSLPDDKPLVLPNPDSVGDLGDIEEVEEDSSSLHLSLTDYPDFISEDKQTESFFPRKLNLDRQLTNSLLISWLAPEIPRNTVIISYQIFVDGEFKTTIKGNERTKALLENVDSKQIHRVTVVCVTTRSRSAHQQCSLLVGKAAVPTPTDLKVSHISANGALLSWWPGNTNYQHVVSVNDQEMRVVNPGVYEYLLTGLAPATSHRVTIRAKSLLANFEEERNKDRKELLTARIEFKTLAGGLPDPPLDVQVEVGPQEGTILLTWLPVTINRSGISPSGVIKGYSIYADDKLIKNVMGPINDHVLLSSANFSGFIPQRLTVRTMDDHGEESVDSQGVILPPNLLKEMAATTAKNIAYEAVAARKDPHNHTPFGQRLDYNSSSELSDIVEVDEEPEGETEALKPTGGQTGPSGAPASGTKVPPDRSPYRSPIRRPSNKSNEKSENRVAQHGMPIPQIEITRDSSTERGNSLEDEDFNLQKHKTSTEDKGKIITRKKSDATGAENYRPPNNNPVPKPEPVVDEFPGNPSEPWRTMITPDRVSSSPSLAKARSHAVVALNSDPYYEDAEDNLQRRIRVVMDPDPMRLFVALFDYDPAVMSPNADACDAELPFREGQVIKIFGDCDSDGFYKGECNGQVGYVPCNMVTEVKVDDPDVVQQLLKESSSTSSGDSSSTPAKENFPSNSLYMSSGLPVASDQLGPGKHMVALYDYDPQELSPNVDSEAELAFKMGDQVIIYGDMDDDGFFIGEVKGKKGLVPSNFIREADTPDEEIERASVTQSQSRDSIPSPNIDEEVSRVSGMGTKSLSECKLDSDGRPASAPHSDEDRKPKRKGGLSSAHSMTSMGAGLLSKGKNIFKKFTR